MKKWMIIVLAILVCFPLLAGGQKGGGKEGEPIKLMLGSPVAENNPFTVGCLKFAELVNKKTDGRVTVDVLHSGQLGAEKELLESVMQGSVDMLVTSTGPLNAWIEEVLVFDLPYLFRDKEHFYHVLDSDVCRELVIEPLKELGIYAFSMWDAGDRNFFTSVRSIEKPEDFTGLKIRVMENPIYINQVKAMGGNPVALPFSEVYTSFQQGIIDGADNNVMNYYTAGFCEVAKYLSLTGHAYLPGFLGINLKKFEGLPPDIQKAIIEAALEASAYERKYFNDMTDDTLTMLEKEKGVIVTRNPDKTSMYEATKHLYDQYEQKVGGRQVIDAILNIN